MSNKQKDELKKKNKIFFFNFIIKARSYFLFLIVLLVRHIPQVFGQNNVRAKRLCFFFDKNFLRTSSRLSLVQSPEIFDDSTDAG